MKRRKISYVSKGKTNKNWADPHTFFEKFAIKHFFYENWGDLNTFFLTIVERGFKVAYLLSSRNTTKSNREILILLDYSTMLHRTIIHKVGGIQRSSVICFQCFKCADCPYRALNLATYWFNFISSQWSKVHGLNRLYINHWRKEKFDPAIVSTRVCCSVS